MAMMGLRLAEGIDLGRYAALAGAAMPEERIAELAGLGLVESGGGRLRTTPAGRPLLDAVLRRLLDLARQQLAEAVELLERRVADADLAGLRRRAGGRS